MAAMPATSISASAAIAAAFPFPALTTISAASAAVSTISASPAPGTVFASATCIAATASRVRWRCGLVRYVLVVVGLSLTCMLCSQFSRVPHVQSCCASARASSETESSESWDPLESLPRIGVCAWWR
jgi:hypothetical protein